MAGRIRLTEEAIAKLKPKLEPEPKPYTVGDVTRGLRVHVAVSGKRTFQLSRNGTTLTLGECGHLKLAAARQLAVAPTSVVKQERKPVALRTIGAMIDRYCATDAAHLAKNTRRPQIVRQFLDGLLDRPLAALTREWVIARQRALLAEDYKGSSVETFQKGAGIFANWLVDQGYIDRSPFRKLPRIPIDRAFHCLDDAGMHALESACHRWQREPAIACLAMICLCCGLRKGEVLALEWSDVDLDKAWVSVRAATTKTRRGRRVPMPNKLVTFLRQYDPFEHPDKPDRLPEKRPFRAAANYRHWAKLRAAAKLASHITIHGCRHSYASALRRRGADLLEIRDALGHHSLVQTERYMHRLETEGSRVAHLIEAGPVEVSTLSRFIKP